MRGKRIIEERERVQRRIIPAHAGQTLKKRYPLRDFSDHPRACGANSKRSRNWPNFDGSSPRMRGKHGGTYEQAAVGRIIPAHAGQTLYRKATSILRSDHPRACGANHDLMTRGAAWNGSSPRMRGKRYTSRQYVPAGRIIPAHAGQTSAIATIGRAQADHPRACGANSCMSLKNVSFFGSSPRMRGKLAIGLACVGRIWIIPAHAGQTVTSGNFGNVNKDHPRACGANSLIPLAKHSPAML